MGKRKHTSHVRRHRRKGMRGGSAAITRPVAVRMVRSRASPEFRKAMRRIKSRFIAAAMRRGMSVTQANSLYRKMLRMRGAGFWDSLKKFGGQAWDIGKKIAAPLIGAALPSVQNFANKILPGSGDLVGTAGSALQDYLGKGIYIGRGRGIRLGRSR